MKNIINYKKGITFIWEPNFKIYNRCAHSNNMSKP